ncbi:hypothetical protein MIDIC_230042 [Alphaproteobacteria bacterium]
MIGDLMSFLERGLYLRINCRYLGDVCVQLRILQKTLTYI